MDQVVLDEPLGITGNNQLKISAVFPLYKVGLLLKEISLILRIFFTKSKYPTFRQKNSMHNQVEPQCMLHTATKNGGHFQLTTAHDPFQ